MLVAIMPGARCLMWWESWHGTRSKPTRERGEVRDENSMCNTKAEGPTTSGDEMRWTKGRAGGDDLLSYTHTADMEKDGLVDEDCRILYGTKSSGFGQFEVTFAEDNRNTLRCLPTLESSDHKRNSRHRPLRPLPTAPRHCI